MHFLVHLQCSPAKAEEVKSGEAVKRVKLKSANARMVSSPSVQYSR
jgi:hypothetical protein